MHFSHPPHWVTATDLVPYEDAVSTMKARVKAIQEGNESELLWALEHPSLYTLGTGAKREDILDDSLPSFETGRGGEVTYHGPGQRVVYTMLDLNKRTKDLRAYVWSLEEWLLLALKELGIGACRRDGRVGLWVPEKKALTTATGEPLDHKIAAIGVRVSKWVTFHGLALNVHPDLSHFKGIVPCGIRGHGVTSLHKLGVNVKLDEVDQVLKKTFSKVF
ncbi:MAG: lipoyl(octanoyl) transferase LipB [Alphaproteobacteria bacterium]|nr:lipoyl(octanoyl) transferase LipB [Alphaproteobacteria bacterium]NCQ66904.1 lipoyl(octanoyl) transferase LipB [Alphaproteobacteria bacterium]NCT07472.1 lipoyl(octanoyl) transferase LipB [Alphaproteobacteria bacterium]